MQQAAFGLLSSHFVYPLTYPLLFLFNELHLTCLRPINPLTPHRGGAAVITSSLSGLAGLIMRQFLISTLRPRTPFLPYPNPYPTHSQLNSTRLDSVQLNSQGLLITFSECKRSVCERRGGVCLGVWGFAPLISTIYMCL